MGLAATPPWPMERERGREAVADLATDGGGRVAEGCEEDKNQVFCSHCIFLLQADLTFIYWWAENPHCLPRPN
jgi:hypothetical protein